MVASLPGDPGIGAGLASYLGLEILPVFSRRFPDGEIYLRFPHVVEGGEILLVQSMYPAQCDRLVEVLLALEALGRYGSRVHLLVTYLAYARQDREFLSGEAASLRSIVRAVTAFGLETLITVDAHNPRAVREAMSGGRYLNLVPGEVFAEAISRKYGGRGVSVVAPDRGAADRARELAKHLGGDYVVVNKVRDRVTGRVEHDLSPLDSVRDLAVVVDDIVSTGGTVASIASYLTGRGVEVVLAVSHALLVG
ncbi:MAG: ribose-phosphate diphosphokinase, partial [Thermofilaceae archaeon]|nr:ribose-phosphate diphosphokinase [Thermofilaceae archaeon]